MAGKPRTEPTAQALEHAAKCEAIILLVETGATVREAVPRVSNTMTFEGFRKWLKRQPALHARMKAAQRSRDAGPQAVMKRPTRKKPPPPKPSSLRLACAKFFDEIVSLVEGGMSFPQACASKPGYPEYSGLMKYAAADPRRAERVRAASRGWHQSNRYDEADFDRALRRLATDVSDHVERLNVPGLPSYIWMYERSQRDPEFARRFNVAMLRRRMLWHARVENGFATQLFKDPLYRAADAAVPRGIQPSDRDDLRSDVILQLLEERAVGQAVIKRARYHAKAVSLQSRKHQFASLDQSTSSEEGRRSRLDTLTSDVWTFEGAA